MEKQKLMDFKSTNKISHKSKEMKKLIEDNQKTTMIVEVVKNQKLEEQLQPKQTLEEPEETHPIGGDD